MKVLSKVTQFSSILLITMILFAGQAFAQDFKLNNTASKLTVYGTSNLHDWDVKAEKQSGNIVVDLSGNAQIKQLKLIVEAESLKSGKSGMDKNTYDALNTKKHKNIIFDMKSVKSISSIGNGNYKVSVVGNLSIAGTTKSTTLDFTMNTSSSKIVLKGKTSFKMTTFGVKPPKALLGTITTGDAVTIDFNTTFIK